MSVAVAPGSDALDRSGREDLIADLTNRYLLEGHPKLQTFDGA